MQETKPKIDINKKYKTRKGDPVRILCTDRKSERCKYPVIALITFSNDNEVCSTYNEVGEYSSEDHDLDLIEVQPWEDFNIDDPVLVSKEGVEWYKRHFAGCSPNGYPMAFNNGWTSFTAEDSTYVTPWKYCKKPEDIDV